MSPEQRRVFWQPGVFSDRSSRGRWKPTRGEMISTWTVSGSFRRQIVTIDRTQEIKRVRGNLLDPTKDRNQL